jgi:mono/diheme cytochrome c family protein
MLKKILKWTGAILILFIFALSIVVATRQHLQFDAPYPDIKASSDSAVIARGKYLVKGPAHCADCHASPKFYKIVNEGGDAPLTGGRGFELPIGVVYSRNITPDSTGIGQFSDAQIARALRYGVGHDNRALIDFMPFHNTSDQDLTAIISYVRTLAPVRNEVQPNEFNVLGKVVKAFLIKPVGPKGEVLKTVTSDSSIEYGKYLATSVSNCRGCHTNRNLMTGAFVGPDYAGGFRMDSNIDPKNFKCVSPNITPDSTTGRLMKWSEDIFIKRFRMGKLIQHSPMPWGPFSRMSDTELKAIYRYLQTVTPVKNDPGPVLIAIK